MDLKKRYIYLLAVSGGQDSMYLLHLALKHLPKTQIIVAHFNHKTRGLESERDRKFVENFCKKENLKLYVGNRKGEKTSEAALRTERIRFLKETRIKAGADYILTAHHLDDQIETLMMRLMRGTGMDGLSCIPEKRGKFLRPLLETTREEIASYVKQNGIPYVEDSSNSGSDYLRNRIRNELLPKFFELGSLHGSKTSVLKRFGETLKEISWVTGEMKDQTDFLYQIAVTETDFWSRLDLSLYNKWEKEWQKRVLRKTLHRLGAKKIGRQEIAQIQSMKGKSVSLTNKIQVSHSCEYLYFQNEKQRRLSAKPLETKEAKGLWECTSLGLKIRLSPTLQKEGVLRFSALGDRRGAQKMKKLFLNQRIPSFERKLLPVLVNSFSEEVIWCFPEARSGVLIEQNHFPFSFLS